MKLFICVDDNGGVAFGGKRQSRDAELINYMFEKAEPEPLYIKPFSEKLFKDEGERVQIVDDFAELPEEAVCFLEGESGEGYETSASTIFLCKWNRDYPYDLELALDLSSYKLMSETEIVGKSHEKITVEEYVGGKTGRAGEPASEKAEHGALEDKPVEEYAL